MLRGITGIIAVSFITACTRSAVDRQDPLIGAWWIVETTVTTPDSSWVDGDPERGLYVFTKGHFSNMLIQGANPREVLPPGATPEQRLAAYDPFIADAGSYVRTDSALITQNLIAKVPNVMDARIEYHYRLDGDTLTLTFSGAWAPPSGQISYRLVRLAEDSE